MIKNNLLYLSNSNYGGWVSFSYHISKILNVNHILKIKKTFRGGGIFYGDIMYKNITKEILHKFKNPIILAVDKSHYQYLKLIKEGTIIIHDPTELSKEVLEFAKKNKVITIRKTVSALLNNIGINNTFLKHPFYKYDKFTLPKKYNRSLSRVDFDKNTHIICKANNEGANVEIYGYKNHIYYFHKLKELNFDKYYKGYYSKKINDISKLYAETKFLVDLSTIKKDGGGTQYTFLEAEYHECSIILHKEWCNVEGSVYKNNFNCYTVSNEKELIQCLNKKPINSNLLPTDYENNKWKTILLD